MTKPEIVSDCCEECGRAVGKDDAQWRDDGTPVHAKCNGKGVTVQDALPVLIQFLKLTDVAEVLSEDLQTGIALEQLLIRSLDRLNNHMSN